MAGRISSATESAARCAQPGNSNRTVFPDAGMKAHRDAGFREVKICMLRAPRAWRMLTASKRTQAAMSRRVISSRSMARRCPSSFAGLTFGGAGGSAESGGRCLARARRLRGLTAGMEIESYPQTAGEVKFWGFSALFSARRGAAGVVSGAYTSRRIGGTSARRRRTARVDSSRTWPPKSLNCTGRHPRRW